jgi:tetratricopeptide (TPR) repeat protein
MRRNLLFVSCAAAGLVAVIAAAFMAPHRVHSTDPADAGDPAVPSHGGFANQRPGVAYVGSDACTSCHGLIAENFAAHGMGRTFARIDSAHSIADWATQQVVVDRKTGLRYQPYREGGRFFIREFLLDDHGRDIHSLSREAHYTLGSGTNDQAYVTEHNGFLRMLPLEWYTEENRWDFAPVFEVANQRFSRRINARCMNCHNATPAMESEAAARFALPLPSGVSCERCHGPGSLHVQARLQGYEPSGEVDTTIVNPRHLPALRQLDVCAQCHLQGDAEVLRPGRSQWSFRPGERLVDHRAIFVSPGWDTLNFGFVRHVERLAMSRCFSASGGTMTCTTCHDPHRSSAGQTATYWDNACMRCHSVHGCALPDMGARAGNSCASCHMRRSEPFDVRHVTITDHWIRRRIEPPARNEVARYRPDPNAGIEQFAYPGEEEEPTLEDLELKAIAAGDLGLDGGAREALLEAATFAAAGTAAARPSGVPLVAASHDPLLATALSYIRDARALGTAARLLAASGDSATARSALGRATANDPQDARLAGELARIEAAAGDLAAARPRAEAAAALDPDDPELARLVAEIYAAAGDLPRAVEQYRRALDLDPQDNPSILGLGRSLLLLGDKDQAVRTLGRAAAEMPLDAETHASLGFALASTQRSQTAIDAYQRALALDPGNADLQFNLANSLAAAGDGEAAEAAYREAIRLRPDYYQAYGNLGFLLRQRGDLTGARRAFEQVLQIRPDDATARKALAELR